MSSCVCIVLVIASVECLVNPSFGYWNVRETITRHPVQPKIAKFVSNDSVYMQRDGSVFNSLDNYVPGNPTWGGGLDFTHWYHHFLLGA